MTRLTAPPADGWAPAGLGAALAFQGCVSAAGALVNGAALWVLWVLGRGGRGRSAAAVYLAHLALLDLLAGLALPLRLLPPGAPLCRLLAALAALHPAVALWLQALLAADRCAAVLRPRRARRLGRTRAAALASAGTWACGLAAAAPLLLPALPALPAPAPSGCPAPPELAPLLRPSGAARALGLLRLALFFLVPTGVLVGCSAAVLHGLRRGGASRLRPQLKAKAARAALTLLAQALVCFVPFHLCAALLLLRPEARAQARVGPWGARAALLMNLSVCLDVSLYYLVSKQFQARVTSVLLHRSHPRGPRRTSVRWTSLRALSNLHGAML